MGENGKLDEIRIKELEVFAYHGVYEEERTLGQKFLVNAALSLDMRPAGKSDSLDKSVDYGKVCRLISDFVTGTKYRLLEGLAEHLAEKLLLHFPVIEKADVEIVKPSAPISLPFGSVSVAISRRWKKALISCGSNMGDKETYIRDAVAKLTEDEKCRLTAMSELIVTKPYGDTAQDDFLNGAFVIKTLYEPEELLKILQRLEEEAGRVRTRHWGPRTLDLDIIFYEDKVILGDDLVIPHYDMHNRRFVLEPSARIAPEWVHPVYGKTIGQLLQELPETC